MRDKGSYRDLLGERIENAYREKGDISKPTEIQMAKWKQIAKMRRREKIRRRKIIASLASVFAMVFCVGMVSMFQIPDAEAGRDGIVDIIDSRDDDEVMAVDTYENQEDLPRDIREEFLMFEKLPSDCKMLKTKIITIGKTRRCESQFINKGKDSFLVRQENGAEDETFKMIVVNSDKVESLNGTDIYIKKYSENDAKITYKFIYDDVYVNIMCDNSILEEDMMNIIKEALI